MLNTKTCSRCSASFSCGASETSGGCWCSEYPPIFSPDPTVNCMCPVCLHKATKEKIDQHVVQLTTERALHENKAKDLAPTKNYLEGIDYYIEGSYSVFTSWHYLRRGSCCRNGCRHAPMDL